MVFPGRPGVYHRGFGHGASDDTGARLSLLGVGTEEVSARHGLGLHGLLFSHHVSMVFLGLFAGLLGSGHEWVHWESGAFWPDQYVGSPEPRITTDSGTALCLLPGAHGSLSPVSSPSANTQM